jgi:hypothetical protein
MQAVLIEIGGLRPGPPALALVRTLSSQSGVLRASVNESARQAPCCTIQTVSRSRSCVR